MDRQKDERTDGQNCYINVARQHSCADARKKLGEFIALLRPFPKYPTPLGHLATAMIQALLPPSASDRH